MTSYADTLSDQRRKQCRTYAYASTWLGCFSDVMPENSAIIILYLAMLGASNTLIMLSTSLSGIVAMFLLIPASGIVNKLGSRRMVAVSSLLACFSYLLMAAAPYMGIEIARYIVFFGCFSFCISQPLCTAAWFPILGHILKPSERGDFIGFMRFSYYILTGSVFFLLGILMGAKPPVWFLQIIIGTTGVLALGRYFFIARIPLPEHEHKVHDLKKAFRISIHNGLLVGFSAYVCFLSLAFAAIQPLTLIYLKNGLHFGDNVVQIISSVGVGGSICAFFFYGRLSRRFGIRNLQIAVHIAYIILPLVLFFCSDNIPYLPVVIAVLVFGANFAFANFVCTFSQESLALARPGNISMANSFSQTYQMIGTASGRTVASLLLGNGVLASTWKLWDIPISNFQTIYLICSGFAFFCLILIFCIPSVVPEHDDYYCP